MKIRLTRNWFAPTNPLRRNALEVSSGRRLRKFHTYEIPDSWEAILPTDGSVTILPDDAQVDEVVGADVVVSAENALRDMDPERAAVEAIPQDDDVVPEYVKKRNQKSSAGTVAPA